VVDTASRKSIGWRTFMPTMLPTGRLPGFGPAARTAQRPLVLRGLACIHPRTPRRQRPGISATSEPAKRRDRRDTVDKMGTELLPQRLVVVFSGRELHPSC
jgi:hypothetical protein